MKDKQTNNNKPMHGRPALVGSPLSSGPNSYPGRQEQMKLPGVSVQVWIQPPLFELHSGISEIVKFLRSCFLFLFRLFHNNILIRMKCVASQDYMNKCLSQCTMIPYQHNLFDQNEVYSQHYRNKWSCPMYSHMNADNLHCCWNIHLHLQ